MKWTLAAAQTIVQPFAPYVLGNLWLGGTLGDQPGWAWMVAATASVLGLGVLIVLALAGRAAWLPAAAASTFWLVAAVGAATPVLKLACVGLAIVQGGLAWLMWLWLPPREP